MKKLLLGGVVATFVFVLSASFTFAAQPTDKGFNEFGYNYSARIFNGLADGIDKKLDGKVWGSPAYANDHLTMKWNAAWDACNDLGTPEACVGAWTDNEWNGKVKGGSGEVWHYKIIWVGSEGTASPYWREGGYSVWGSYETIMDQGTFDGTHTWYAHGISNGYGAK